MDGAGSTRLADTLLTFETNASHGRRYLGNQLADAPDGPAVTGEVGQPMTVSKLLPQSIVVGHQPVPLSGGQ
jgi:hypothetical protein